MDAKLQKWFDKYEYEYQGHRFIDCELDVLKELILQSSQSEAVKFVEWLNDNPTSDFVIVRTLGYKTFDELYDQWTLKGKP